MTQGVRCARLTTATRAQPPHGTPHPRPDSSSSLSTFLTARVLRPATSLPAPGSVTQYAAWIGSAVSRPKYPFFCASLPAMITGAAARPLAAAGGRAGERVGGEGGERRHANAATLTHLAAAGGPGSTVSQGPRAHPRWRSSCRCSRTRAPPR
jgi:hypothetical protein